MFSSTRIGGTLVPSALEARSRRLQGADEEQVLGFTASTLNGQWLMLRKGQRSPSSLHNYQCGWEQPRTGKVAAARAEGGNASGRPRRRTAGQKDTSGTKQYYFTREADEPSSFSPINGEFISMAVTAGAVVGLGFVLYQWVSKRGGLSTLPSPSGGIDFSGGADKKFRRESLARLNEFARELRTFQDVDMAGKNFGDEGFIFLAEVLAFNQTLETVDFSANGITATGLKALSQVLPTNTYLKTLNLSGNNIGDEGAQELAPILEKNKGITKLQLNSVNLGDEVIWHIQ